MPALNSTRFLDDDDEGEAPVLNNTGEVMLVECNYFDGWLVANIIVMIDNNWCKIIMLDFVINEISIYFDLKRM